MSATPPLVEAALQLARRFGFAQASLPETGELLRVLATTVADGVLAEIGTGAGVGAAWLTSGMQPAARLVTIELDATLAQAARELFATRSNVTVEQGDWRAILRHAPFALLFADGGEAKRHDPGALITAMRPGGLIVLDDLTPVELWPPEWRGQPDPLRDAWLHDPRLAAVELRVSATAAVIVAARLG